MKYQVGQKVRVKRGLKDGYRAPDGMYFNDEMEKLSGTVVTISYADNDFYKVEGNNWNWVDDFFESVNIFDKNLITDLSVVTLDNGDKLVYIKNEDLFRDFYPHYANDLADMSDINADGSIEGRFHGKTKIVKVEQPVYSTVYENPEDVKEMTVEEISKALGYEVKIVKEK